MNMAQFNVWSLLFFACSLFYAKGQKIPVSVVFEGKKSGNAVTFNCSFGVAPPSRTMQFLVDSISANDIRLYQGKCYLTHTGDACKANECQCSQDGKRYYWIYNEPKERFTATCKAKISKVCSASVSIQFTESDLTPHESTVKICSTTSNEMNYIKGKTSTILSCIVMFIIIISCTESIPLLMDFKS